MQGGEDQKGFELVEGEAILQSTDGLKSLGNQLLDKVGILMAPECHGLTLLSRETARGWRITIEFPVVS